MNFFKEIGLWPRFGKMSIDVIPAKASITSMASPIRVNHIKIKEQVVHHRRLLQAAVADWLQSARLFSSSLFLLLFP